MAGKTLPSEKVKKIIKNVQKLGKAIVAIRGDGFSGNLLGTICLEEDNGDCVLKIGECKCHIHIDSTHVFRRKNLKLQYL